MIKQISLLYRPEGVSREEFKDYWLNVHTAMVKKRLPGLKKYTGSFTMEASEDNPFPGGGRYMDCDAVVELYFEDEAAYRKAMTGSNWRSDDRKSSSATLFDYAKLQFIVAEEYVVDLDEE